MMQLQLLQPGDAEALLSFYESVKGTPGSVWDKDYPAMENVLDDIARACAWAFMEEGRIVASISTEEDDVLLTDCPVDRSLRSVCITRVAVARDHQGQGLAAQLVEALLPILRERGIQAARLLVSDQNPAAMKTYAACGFRIVGSCFMYGHSYFCEERLL